MKVPIRPAPPPPVNQNLAPKSASAWDTFGNNSWNKTVVPAQKKKPPPRPPPPKFANKKTVPSRPSQLIAGLFQRKNNINAKANDVQISRAAGDGIVDSKGTNGLLLIDFTSPPSSPTFTTRSSSDALSVNSFGSDGVTQGSGSSGNASNVESGFEDDFDLFSHGSRKTEFLQPRDPWSPPPRIPEPKNPFNGKSWASFPSPSSSKKIPGVLSTMPTIIRSKPERHKNQPKVRNCDAGSNADKLADVFQTTHVGFSKTGLNNSIFEEEDDDGWSSESPPMPTCPPPPPPEMLNDLLQSVDNAVSKIFCAHKRFGIDFSFLFSKIFARVSLIKERKFLFRF